MHLLLNGVGMIVYGLAVVSAESCLLFESGPWQWQQGGVVSRIMFHSYGASSRHPYHAVTCSIRPTLPVDQRIASVLTGSIYGVHG